MPFARYFAYVGSVLLALLCIVDWYLPPLSADPASSDFDHPTIRIHSARKWPSAVVIDTTLPTIVPPVATMTAAPVPPPPAKPAHEAFAMATEQAPAVKAAEPGKPAKPRVRHTRTARAPTGQVGNYGMFGFRTDAFASRNWPMSW